MAKVRVPRLLPADVKARGPSHPRVAAPVVLDKQAIQPATQTRSTAAPAGGAQDRQGLVPGRGAARRDDI